MDPLGLIAVAFLAFLCSDILRRDCLIIAQPILGLAAPPNAGLHNGWRMGIERLRSASFKGLRSVSLKGLCNLDYMEDYLGKSRCTNRFNASALLLNLSRIVSPKFASRSLRSQSGMTMIQSAQILFADATSRITSFGQTTMSRRLLPTGAS